MWRDEWFASRSIHAKLLFFYCFTNSYIGFTGIYELPDRVILFDTGLNENELAQAKENLREKVIFYNGWACVINAEKLDPIRGEKNSLHIARNKELENIPQNIISYFTQVLEGGSMGGTPLHGNGKGNGKGKGIDSLTDEFCEEVSNQYSVMVKSVQDIREDLIGYTKSHGKKYKDYRATLQNWVRRALKQGEIKKQVKTTLHNLPEISDIQRAENMAKLAELKARLI